MRLPIRSQILLPLAALQIAVISLVTVWAAWAAALRVEQEIAGRLDSLGGTIESAGFPITANVLRQMKLLSGADYLLLDAEGAVLESTLTTRAPLRIPADSDAEVSTTRLQEVGFRSIWVDAGRASAPGHRVLILFPQAELHELQREAITGPLLTGGLILTLTVLATTWVAHRMGRRMQIVRRQVARIASGDFEPLSVPDRDDEIRDLSLSVNRMGLDLQTLTAAIRDTERAQLTAQVVGGFAHQLRNAMTGIRMAIQVHQKRCDSGNDRSLPVALAQLSLTEQQIRGLLRLARGQEQPPAPGCVTQLLDEVAAMVEPICEHRRIAWSFRADCPPNLHVADADAFRSALLNLCINGIEAAGDPGELSVIAEHHDDRIVVEVHDNGPGVPDDLRDLVFAPYVTTKPEGVGLGLALTRRAAESLGGSVDVERRGSRTVFTFCCAVSTADIPPHIRQPPQARRIPSALTATVDSSAAPLRELQFSVP